ncbi:uncharacterized protein Dere_GG18714 [Drosophila erecta]|uniref:Uncharacterized protein n=2 Tax=Drosophila erecta TaxID=7220 RepID=B3NU42_DROER|nr:uncharacterized protein Dere_GG18714 [Drosophila erecta]
MCLVATRVAGETMIEVDENGDEYELKRFYIQGRQLRGDGSQSQCVVTRRKRSGRAAGSVSAAALSVSSQPVPAKEHREGGAVLQEVENNNRRFVALTGVHVESPLPQGDVHNDDDDDDEQVDNDGGNQSSQYVPAALALPLQSQSTASHLNQGVSVVANAASHANVAEDAGIVVVQSHQPPKVNPDTHAVFELKPVQSDVAHQSAGISFYPFVQPWEQHEDDYDEDDYDEEDYDDFYYGGNGFYRDQPGFNGLGVFEEEIISEDQPVSTIASWSTGEDDSDILPAFNKRPNQKNKNKNKNKQNQKQKIKNQQQKIKRQQQKKRKQEAQNDEQPAKQKKKPQQQDKDQKKKQDKDQKKPEENQSQQAMDQLTPVEVITKPVVVEQSSVVSSSTSSNIAASSSNISSSSGSNSSDKKKKKKKKKKKPSSSSSGGSSLSQRKTKKKKKRPSSSSSISSNSNKRRRPSSSIDSSSGSSPIGGYRRRRPQQQQLQQQRRRKTQQQQKRRRLQQQQKRRRQQQQQRRRLRNKNRQFYGDEPIINCIYINKDPATTTTPRPFWNILGRQSDSKPSATESSVVSSEESQTDPVAKQAVLQAVRRNFGEFGGRKRTNLRFVS